MARLSRSTGLEQEGNIGLGRALYIGNISPLEDLTPRSHVPLLQARHEHPPVYDITSRVGDLNLAERRTGYTSSWVKEKIDAQNLPCGGKIEVTRIGVECELFRKGRGMSEKIEELNECNMKSFWYIK